MSETISIESALRLADGMDAMVKRYLAARDREWREALLPVAGCIECNTAFGFYPVDREPCRYCAPLRALLAQDRPVDLQTGPQPSPRGDHHE